MPKCTPDKDEKKLLSKILAYSLKQFLADRTNGRAIGTVLRLSVCDVMYCG